MDKYEYKLRAEEIKSLIAQGEYAEAAAIADSIDWRRVKSVMMLCTVSDLYKINRRLEDARDMLLLAYDRHPGGRSIVYSLCELSIKMGDLVNALGYYREFVQEAPKDSGRYILKYKLFEAQEVSLEERIEVLEELKSKDYSEKWAYELAYLYHRVGLGSKCVEECDELILWFGDGKYVRKALELKQLHEPLTPAQQEKYEAMKTGTGPVQSAKEETPVSGGEPDLMDAPTREIPQKDLDIQVKVMKVGQYDTINMQKELAENMKEFWGGSGSENQEVSTDTGMLDLPDEEEDEEEDMARKAVEELSQAEETKVEEVFFGETGEINSAKVTNLQEIKEKLAAQPAQEEKPETPAPIAVQPAPVAEQVEPEPEASQDIHPVEQPVPMEVQSTPIAVQPAPVAEPEAPAPESKPEASQDTHPVQQPVPMEAQPTPIVAQPVPVAEQTASAPEPKQSLPEAHLFMEQPSKFDNMLGMEYDGQFSLVVPEAEKVEKQITGQLQLEEVLLEWEKMKKDNEQKRMEAVRQHVLEQTGSLFTEFDAAVKDGLLEKLEKDSLNETASVEVAGENTDGELEVLESGELPDESVEAETEELEEITEAEDAEENTEESTDEAESENLQEEMAEDTEEEQTEETVEDAGTAEAAENTAENTKEAESAEESEEETEEAEEETDEAEEKTKKETKKETQEEIEEETDEEAEDGSLRKAGEKSEEKESRVRELSEEEEQLFAAYIQNRKTKEQIVHAIDHVSMAAYTGNVIITGEEGEDTLALAKNLIKELQQTDSNFSGKVAKILGESLNQKELEPILDRLKNGALIVQHGGDLKQETVSRLRSALEQENNGMVILLEDTKKAIHKLLKANKDLAECFNIRIDIEELDNGSLVEYGKKYAKEQEYSIDEFGVLALHTRIAERQTSDHVVTVAEVKDLVDAAISHANRKSFNHFVDILLAKRYDEEDMIILREKDFM